MKKNSNNCLNTISNTTNLIENLLKFIINYMQNANSNDIQFFTISFKVSISV